MRLATIAVFEAAQIDLDASKVLMDRGLFQPTLLKDFADLEIRDSKSQLPNVTNANQRVVLQNVINAIERYKSSLDRVVQRLDLRKNYIKNVQNYSQLVREKYDYYQNSSNKQSSLR